MTGLPGGVTTAELTADLRRYRGRPDLAVVDVRCTPLDHRASAPTTAGLHRVTVHMEDDEEVHLVVKGLQAARHGLPPVIPAEVRAHLDTIIPWRLEIDVLTGLPATRMPPGLRLPTLVGVHEQDDDRATLWTEDVEPVDTPWTSTDTETAAHLLGRLAARRRDDPPLTIPGGDFLTSWCATQLTAFAAPRLLDPTTWAHPLFAEPALASLRPVLTALATRWPDEWCTVQAARQLPAHGDPTPMNLLRAPDGDLVAIDWGTSTPAPVGWDLVPLVFGRAEAGAEDPHDLGTTLDRALTAHRAGLAEDGVHVELDDLRHTVLAAATLRYPLTCLPLSVLHGEPEERGRALQRAAFVRAVLALSGR